MVYIGRDGRVYEDRPWSLERIIGIFTGFIAFIVAFFKSLFAPLAQAQENFNDRRGGGGGGGGGWGGGGGRGPPRPPQRRIGRITTISDCTIPGGG